MLTALHLLYTIPYPCVKSYKRLAPENPGWKLGRLRKERDIDNISQIGGLCQAITKICHFCTTIDTHCLCLVYFGYRVDCGVKAAHRACRDGGPVRSRCPLLGLGACNSQTRAVGSSTRNIGRSSPGCTKPGKGPIQTVSVLQNGQQHR